MADVEIPPTPEKAEDFSVEWVSAVAKNYIKTIVKEEDELEEDPEIRAATDGETETRESECKLWKA